MGSESMSSSLVQDSSSSNSIPASSALIGSVAPRIRRKSAAKAAAFVTATIKEEMLVPNGPPIKRSHSRGGGDGGTRGFVNNHNPAASSSSHKGDAPFVPSAAATRPSKSSSSSSQSTTHSSRKKTALSSFAVEYLKSWMMSPDHIEHPYPTEDEKAKIMKETGIELKQLTNWFVNNRKRFWKPKVEELMRQNGNGNASLQEIAAKQHANPPQRPNNKREHQQSQQQQDQQREQQRQRANGDKATKDNNTTTTPQSTLVSSEGEDSSGSGPGPQDNGRKPASKGFKKRRMKYSASETTHGNNNDRASSAPRKKGPGKRPRRPSQAVSARTTAAQASLPASASKNNVPAATTTPSVPRIHVASDYASVKAARKMSGESSRSGGSVGFQQEGATRQRVGELLPSSSAAAVSSPRMVSNPLAVTLSPKPSAAVPSSSSGDVVVDAAPAGRVQPAAFAQGFVDAGLVTDLDYSISPMDNQVVANTGTAASAAAAAAAAGFCCNVMPHSCNLADPLGNKNRNAPPCALCSACRDWNLGEFCPWDLTGIIGDVSADGTVPSSPPSSRLSPLGIKDDFTAPVSTLPPVASSPYDRMDTDGTIEEATTVTENNNTAQVSDVASDDNVDLPDCEEEEAAFCHDSSEEDEEHLRLPKLPTSLAMASSPSELSFAIPHEISHSTSAADFISSIVDLETWE